MRTSQWQVKGQSRIDRILKTPTITCNALNAPMVSQLVEPKLN